MNPECLVIFQGPSHFISRKLYPSYKVFFVKFGAYCAASLIHSSILMLSAMFLPAMSNAVPWSTDVLKNGKPFVIEIVLWKSVIFAAICPWSRSEERRVGKECGYGWWGLW